MKLAIMQPYLFPYLGYFQLIAAVDKFVFYDDVNFIKNGWINRNRLFLAGEVRYVTVPLADASSFSKINQILVQPRSTGWPRKLLETVRHSYCRAPYFGVVQSMLSEIFLTDDRRVAELAKGSVIAVSKYLGLRTRFVMSSAMYKNSHLGGVERVFDICRREEASQYVNLPGGSDLYDHQSFASRQLTLRFIEPKLTPYRQFSAQFCSSLSVLDVLMFNDRETARAMLYTDETPQ
jgi:WbqC-like protein family